MRNIIGKDSGIEIYSTILLSGFMSDSDSPPQKEVKAQEDVESRRKFLKVSAVAGVSVAALAAGINFLPSIAAAAKSSTSSNASPDASTSTNNPLIVVINGDELDVYQGENKYISTDPLFARSITSQVNARI